MLETEYAERSAGKFFVNSKIAKVFSSRMVSLNIFGLNLTFETLNDDKICLKSAIALISATGTHESK